MFIWIANEGSWYITWMISIIIQVMVPWKYGTPDLPSNMSMLRKPFCEKKVTFPDSKVHGANKGPIWSRQDPGGPHVGPMNLAIWVVFLDGEHK